MSTLSITPGSGALVRTDLGNSSGAHMQVTKLAEGTTGSDNLLPATVALGLLVNVSQVQGTVAVTNATPGNLKVDASGVTVPVANAGGGSLTVNAPAATPVAMRLSTGSAFIDTIPVSIAATVPVTGSVAVTGTPAVTQSGTWNIGTIASITNAVAVTGTVALSGTSAVSGTVTANQGTPAALANAWPHLVSDGTHSAGLTQVGSPYGLNVVPLSAPVGGGISQQDKTAFTEGTTYANPIAGVYNDSPAGNPAANQASVVRITPLRGMHVNLRNQAGTEIGTAAAPLQSQPAPSSGAWKSHVSYTAGQTGQTVYAPASGKTVYVEGLIILPTAAGTLIQVFDQTNSASTLLFSGYPPLSGVVITPTRPIPLSAINNILSYTSGSGSTGDITAWGYAA